MIRSSAHKSLQQCQTRVTPGAALRAAFNNVAAPAPAASWKLFAAPLALRRS